MNKHKPTAKEELLLLGQWKAPTLDRYFYPKEMRNIIRTMGDIDDKQKTQLTKTDLIQVRKVIDDYWSKMHTFDNLNGRILRLSPYVLFVAYEDQKPLGQFVDFAKGYLKFLQKLSRPRITIRTVQEFLYEYPKDWTSFDIWLDGLRALIRSSNEYKLNAFQKRNDKYRILYKNGPKSCATFLYSGKGSIDENLSKMGLTNMLMSGQFAMNVHQKYLSLLSKELAIVPFTKIMLSRLEDFVFEDSNWRFPDQKPLVAEHLLKPFIDNDPTEDSKKRIQYFLVEHFGDPRIKRGGWLGVSEPLKQIIRRWLVGATLRDFFKVIDRTAVDHMWRYRHAFWDAYLRKDVITDAWVALGSNARIIARQYLSKEALTQYGELNTGDQSVLLLKIAGVTFVEWSHNGRCRIWTKQTKSSPELYRKYYTRDNLKSNSCDYHLSHTWAETYSWQENLSGFIYDKTRISVGYSDYKV